MSQNSQTHKRRIYFIKKNFQFKFILKFCAVIFIGAVISTGLLFLLSKGTLTSSFHESRLVITNTSLAILPAVIYTNLITLGLITLASIAVTLLVSHKLAGPMFRFEKDLEVIGKGDLTGTTRLRKRDQMTRFAESLNKMTVSLHDKISDIQKDVEQLEKSASQKDVPKEILADLKHLNQKIGSGFQL